MIKDIIRIVEKGQKDKPIEQGRLSKQEGQSTLSFGTLALLHNTHISVLKSPSWHPELPEI